MPVSLARSCFASTALLLTVTAGYADPIGSSAAGNLSTVVIGRTGLADGVTYEGGEGGQPAVVSGPVSTQPAGPSIDANAIAAPTVRAWLKGFGIASHTGSDAFSSGFDVRGGGAVAGVERFVAPNFLVGVAFGGSSSRTEGPSLSSDAESGSLALYASWIVGGLEADALGGISQTRFSNSRTLLIGALPVFTQGDVDAPGFNAAGDLGYRFRFGTAAGAAYLKPFAGLNYVEIDRRSYQEAAAGLPGSYLQFPDQSFRRFASLAGIDGGVTTTWADGISLRPEFRLAWAHDFIDPAPLVNATFVTPIGTAPFVTRDPEPGLDGLVVGAMVTAWKAPGFEVFASYSGEFRQNFQGHLATVGLRASW